MKRAMGMMAIIVIMAATAVSAQMDGDLGLTVYVKQGAIYEASFQVQDIHEYGFLDIERIGETRDARTFNNTNQQEQREYERESGTVYRDVVAHFETMMSNVSMTSEGGAAITGGSPDVPAGNSAGLTATASGTQTVQQHMTANFSNGGHASSSYAGSTSITVTASK